MHIVSEGGRVVNRGATATPTQLSRALAAGMQDAGFRCYDGPKDLWRRGTENIQGRSVIQHRLELWFSLFVDFVSLTMHLEAHHAHFHSPVYCFYKSLPIHGGG